jgi:glycerol-3-phosphate dehydrogenase
VTSILAADRGSPGTTVTVADVAIVGAGVVGCAIARELAGFSVEGRPLSVVLVEARQDVGDGTNTANPAILQTGFDATPGTLEARLVRRGYELASAYADQVGIPVERTGATLVAWTPDELGALPGLLATAQRNGYRQAAVVGADEVYRQLPALGPGALGGLVVPGESITCPWTTTLALATEAVLRGVRLALGHEVTGVRVEDEVTTLATGAGDVPARWVVNAAGLGADVLDRRFGHDRFTVTPRRGELLVYDKLARPLAPRIVLPVPGRGGQGVLVAPTAHGTVMLGPTAADVTDRTATGTSPGGFAVLRARGHQIVPGLLAEEITAAYAGLWAVTDHRDYLVEVDDERRYLLVGGIGSTGLTAALAIAEHVRGLLAEALLDPDPFGHRDDLPAPPRMPNLGEVGLRPYADTARVAADPEYGRVVCFCERVTAGELRDALGSVLPPRDLDGLRRRTRAMNGRCQGASCGAEVSRWLERSVEC